MTLKQIIRDNFTLQMNGEFNIKFNLVLFSNIDLSNSVVLHLYLFAKKMFLIFSEKNLPSE